MGIIILCPKCGGTRLMKLLKDGKEYLHCPKCNYTLTEEDKKK